MRYAAPAKAIRISLISQFVVTGESAGGTRGWALVRELARRGHSTHLISGSGHYLELEHRAPASEIRDGVHVTRIPTSRRFRHSFLARLANSVRFSYGAWHAGMSQPRPDVVIASIQPIFTGVAGWLVAWLRRATLILEVRDAWPESAVAAGVMRNPLLVIACRALAWFLYHSAAAIVVVSPGLRDVVRGYGRGKQDIFVLPNGVDDELFGQLSDRREQVRRARRWNGKYVVMYTGAHVLTARLEDVVNAAASEPHGHFVLVGDGDRKPQLRALARQQQLDNIEFLPACPSASIPHYLAAADAVVMALHAGEHWSLFFQNKFFDYLGSGKPIVAAVIGDQRDVIERAGCGLCPLPERPDEIAASVRWLRTHPTEGLAMGARGRAWGLQYLRRSEFVRTFADLVETTWRINSLPRSERAKIERPAVVGYEGYRRRM